MPDYRRNQVPGGFFFCTVNLLDRRSNLLVATIDALRDWVRRARPGAPFTSKPGSSSPTTLLRPQAPGCATLWTLPQGDAAFPDWWRAIKTGFAKSLPIGAPRSPVITRRGERGIWQRWYWKHTIGDDRDFAAHPDYANFNPAPTLPSLASG
jgi:putative transposase